MSGFIRDLPLVIFFVIVAFPLAMAGVAIFAAVHARRRAAVVKATPTSPIGTASDGYREFEGRTEAVEGRTIRAPLTEEPVVWYQFRVERWADRSGDTAGAWQTVKHDASSTPFLVRDATGIAAVLPFGAEVTPTDKSRWYGDGPVPKNRRPPKVKPTESATGMVDIAGTATFRYYEERIYAGDPLLVLGDYSSGRAGPPVQCAEEEDQAVLDRARAATTATIQQPRDKATPFMMTTTPQAEHLRLTGAGSSAALGIAVIPLLIAAWLVWMRFGS